MRPPSNSLFGALLGATSLIEKSVAQTVGAHTDPDTGISFQTWTVPETSTDGGMVLGVSLPGDALTVDSTEFIGILTCSMPTTPGEGWCGISLTGPMTGTLLLMAWPQDGEILTSFQSASGYDNPESYTGNVQLTQISSYINTTHYELIYRCENCFAFEEDGAITTVSTSAGFLVLGWCQSTTLPVNPECAADVSVAVQHDNGQSIFGGTIGEDAVHASYSEWATLATGTPTGECSGTPTETPTGTVSSQPVPTGLDYDYIVVGGGAGGIPVADKLSEAGHKVLLIEKGPPSTGRWGGSMKPDWLEGTDLTRFDVPGLCNQIWHDSAGIACDDMDQMAGCVLGGGTAVNAGLWWKPNSLDWDYNFPAGWQASDMAGAENNVFSRIPGTTTPSTDGQLYSQQGFGVITSGLGANGWTQINLNGNPDLKNHTFGNTPYMYSNGERGGPMATYLVSADQRSNFDLWTGTMVKKLVRTRGHVTAVEVEAFIDGGYEGTIPVAISGRVILSAGTFGTPKILMRSGIGRTDQLEVVAASEDGATMISSDEWLELPVGNNLMDHVNTDTVITHPDVVHYDFYEAWDNPIAADKNNYLNSRTGILAQAAPNIGPLFFDEITGTDGITRQLQWTARVEGGHDTPDGNAMVISQYLGRGMTSRGQMSIDTDLNTYVSTLPYLNNQWDIDAVIKGVENLQAALSTVANLVFTYPAEGTSAADFVNNMLVSYSNRRANHWMGSCKLGTDDARNGGNAVVDTNTKVWGTDNLFVVDASIFPGMVTTNPSAYVVVASEHAAQKIMGLPVAVEVARYGQCDGQTWNGSYTCAAPYTCQYQNPYYSQCL